MYRELLMNNQLKENRKMETLEQLFIKYNVPHNVSFMCKVQTLISIHNLSYDMILKLYREHK